MPGIEQRFVVCCHHSDGAGNLGGGHPATQFRNALALQVDLEVRPSTHDMDVRWWMVLGINANDEPCYPKDRGHDPRLTESLGLSEGGGLMPSGAKWKHEAPAEKQPPIGGPVWINVVERRFAGSRIADLACETGALTS